MTMMATVFDACHSNLQTPCASPARYSIAARCSNTLQLVMPLLSATACNGCPCCIISCPCPVHDLQPAVSWGCCYVFCKQSSHVSSSNLTSKVCTFMQRLSVSHCLNVLGFPLVLSRVRVLAEPLTHTLCALPAKSSSHSPGHHHHADHSHHPSHAPGHAPPLGSMSVHGSFNTLPHASHPSHTNLAASIHGSMGHLHGSHGGGAHAHGHPPGPGGATTGSSTAGAPAVQALPLVCGQPAITVCCLRRPQASQQLVPLQVVEVQVRGGEVNACILFVCCLCHAWCLVESMHTAHSSICDPAGHVLVLFSTATL
jgi:hypothetical protein